MPHLATVDVAAVHLLLLLSHAASPVASQPSMSRLRRIQPLRSCIAWERAPALRISRLCMAQFRAKEKSLTKHAAMLCQGRMTLIYSRCHLDLRFSKKVLPAFSGSHTLCGIPTYPRHITSAFNVAEYSAAGTSSDPMHLTAPSAVHLITCFSPGSQLPGLSVEAS